MRSDYSQANDLSGVHPEKLNELKQRFDEAAERYHVYPLDDRGTARLASPKPTPSDPDRRSFTFYGGATRLPETAAPNTKNKSHTIAADIVIADEPTEGVIVAMGGQSAGYVLYVQDGRLTYHYNWFDEERTVVTSAQKLTPGPHHVILKFDYDDSADQPGAGGDVTLSVDDQTVGSGRVPRTVAGRFGIDTFGVGADTGSPVAKTYNPPFKFTGRIEQLTIELQPRR